MLRRLIINSLEAFMRHGVPSLCILSVGLNDHSKDGAPLSATHTLFPARGWPWIFMDLLMKEFNRFLGILEMEGGFSQAFMSPLTFY